MVALIVLGVGTLVVLSVFIGFSAGQHQPRSEIKRQAAVRRALNEQRRALEAERAARSRDSSRRE